MSVFSQAVEYFAGIQPEQHFGPSFLELLVAISKAQDILKSKPLRASLRVAVLARTLAKRMELSPRESTFVVQAALIYDMGLARIASDLHRFLARGTSEKQIFFNHALLNARVISSSTDSPNQADIQSILNHHPQAMADWIQRLYLPEEVQAIVAAHHELCDGSGYPLGLTKLNIPIGAKILAFCDTAEGVMSDVSGLTTRKQALENFVDFKIGDKFDPLVAEAFRGLLDDEDDFFRQIYSLEVEEMLFRLVPDRSVPMSGKMLLDILLVFAEMIDAVLPLYRKEHSKKVAQYAVKIAENIGINREQCGELMIAGLLHDVGMLAVPLEILLKPNQLNQEEWNIIHDHPRLTEEVLKGITGFGNIIQWASEHHERMNGRGYPCQKKGFEISVGGRILAIADVFDALTSPRPYRPHAHEQLDALPIMGQGRFSLYDNQLISVLRKVILNTPVVA